jgi:hypothetical protein
VGFIRAPPASVCRCEGADVADRWQAGDRAKCVNVGDIRLPFRTVVAQGGRYLELGRVYPVSSVDVSFHGELCLDVGAEYGSKLAKRFVRVPPEPADRESRVRADRKVAA